MPTSSPSSDLRAASPVQSALDSGLGITSSATPHAARWLPVTDVFDASSRGFGMVVARRTERRPAFPTWSDEIAVRQLGGTAARPQFPHRRPAPVLRGGGVRERAEPLAALRSTSNRSVRAASAAPAVCPRAIRRAGRRSGRPCSRSANGSRRLRPVRIRVRRCGPDVRVSGVRRERDAWTLRSGGRSPDHLNQTATVSVAIHARHSHGRDGSPVNLAQAGCTAGPWPP